MRLPQLFGAVAILAALSFPAHALDTNGSYFLAAFDVAGDGGSGKDSDGDGEKDKNDKDCKKKKDCKDKDHKDGKPCKDNCGKKDKDCKDDKDDCKCPYKILTTDHGCGCQGAELHVSVNKEACCLSVQVTAKQPVIESYIFIGDALLDDPIEAPFPPFFEGCSLLINYLTRADYPSGPTGCIAIPEYPALVGKTFELQAVATFAPFVTAPDGPDLTQQFMALTQAVRVEFK